MHLQELILEDETVSEDTYIVQEVREAAIGLLQQLKKTFGGKAGFTFVLGYKETSDLKAADRKYVSALKHDFIGELETRINVKDALAYDIIEEITELDDDGAFLIDSRGNILHNGYRLRPDPEDVLEEMEIPNHRTLGQRFGFSRNVGTRHTSAIAASYKMPQAEIYVLSEESRDIRGFHKGRIVLSPYEQEVYGRTESRESIFE